jgi:hypothetical protein
MPQWLNPMRESFWPARRWLGFVGSITICSSACRRNEQSWLTLIFFGEPEKTFWHPRVLTRAPAPLPPPLLDMRDCAPGALARFASIAASSTVWITPSETRGSCGARGWFPSTTSRLRSTADAGFPGAARTRCRFG